MNNPSSDQQLVNFLKQYRPNLPESAPDLELKVLATIERNEEAEKKQYYRKKIHSVVSNNRSIIPGFPQWAFPPAMAAILIVFVSGYRLLVPTFYPDEGAHLEAFLVNNWEDLLHDCRSDNVSDISQTDWFNFAVSDNSERLTN